MYGSKHNIIKTNIILDIFMIQELSLLGFILNVYICGGYHAGVKYANNNVFFEMVEAT
ncbi:MAG: hypothetical protein K6F77_09615 [Lachnospiraceae bacterium]|nr:hypothetical protein [Lachnospiraceae bacterium]